MGLKMLWSGVDVSAYIDESSIDIKDALGQGAGAGTLSSGRAATFDFITTLGPVYNAVASGTAVHVPTLVRLGEIQMYDATNTQIYGGFAVHFEDVPMGKTAQGSRVKVSCYDYWQHLDRVMLNETYDGLTDIQTISRLVSKYAPWLSLKALPSLSNYQFAQKYYRNMSLQKAIQSVADITGFMVWVGWDKTLHYVTPASAQLSPFNLSDAVGISQPAGTVPYQITDAITDDTSAINRVFVFGGKTPSGDFTQDLSMFANGSNLTFPLLYYPRAATDGKIHVKVGGVVQAVGSATGQTAGPVTKFNNPAKNVLKVNGGLADVLVNYDAHTLTFGVAPANLAAVTATYRYEYPLAVVVPDPNGGLDFWGMWLDGAISDNTIYDRKTAVQRARVLLLEQSRGLTTLTVETWTGGLQAGQLVHLDNTVRAIHDNFVIQEVETVPFAGAGSYLYTLTLGSWNWHIIDTLKQMQARVDQNAGVNGINGTATPDTVDNSVQFLVSTAEHLSGHLVVSKTAQGSNPYVANVGVLSGVAFPGFSSCLS